MMRSHNPLQINAHGWLVGWLVGHLFRPRRTFPRWKDDIMPLVRIDYQYARIDYPYTEKKKKKIYVIEIALVVCSIQHESSSRHLADMPGSQSMGNQPTNQPTGQNAMMHFLCRGGFMQENKSIFKSCFLPALGV